MRLYLLRHAIAAQAQVSEAQHDSQRSLTQGGQQQARQVAAALKKLKIPLDLIVASPYRRTIQTAEQLKDAFGKNLSIQPLEELKPETKPQDTSLALGFLAGHEHVVFVGHLPHLSLWLGALVASSDSFRCKMGQCALACVDVEQVPPKLHSGTLCWLMTFEQLTLIGQSNEK